MCFPIIALTILSEILICEVLLFITTKHINVLTEEGEIERQQWKGLKKYMEDFSLLNEKDIPDLELWEKYLVYATAFGISDKVIEQLKVVYPHFNEMNNKNCSYIYLMNDSYYGSNFLHEVDKSCNKVYNAYILSDVAQTSISSGSGGGGGFSGGGGGRRWRWPDAVEDKIHCMKKVQD